MKRKSLKFRHVLAFIFLILVYCGSLRVPDTNLPNLKSEDIVGTWKLSKKSVRKLKGIRTHGHVHAKLSSGDNFIVLKEDGRCSLRTYIYTGHYTGEYVHLDGTWKLKKRLEDLGLSYLGTNIVDMDLNYNSYSSGRVRLYVGKRGSRLVLFDFILDPDQNETIEWERGS